MLFCDDTDVCIGIRVHMYMCVHMYVCVYTGGAKKM